MKMNMCIIYSQALLAVSKVESDQHCVLCSVSASRSHIHNIWPTPTQIKGWVSGVSFDKDPLGQSMTADSSSLKVTSLAQCIVKAQIIDPEERSHTDCVINALISNCQLSELRLTLQLPP